MESSIHNVQKTYEAPACLILSAGYPGVILTSGILESLSETDIDYDD